MGEADLQPDVEESTEPPLPNPARGRAPSNSTLETSASTALDTAKSTAVNSGLTTPSVAEDSGPRPPNLSLVKPEDWKSFAPSAHTLAVADIANALHVDIQHGLSRAEASSRLQRDGPNTVETAKTVSIWKVLIKQVSNSLTVVLALTMALSFGIDDYIEGGVIAAVIILNVIVGFIQEYRAEVQILSLKSLLPPMTKVLRNGRVETVTASSIVVGDVIHLAIGDIVPADLRLFEGMNTSVDESTLTGESLPVDKTPEIVLSDPETPIGDRTNMAFSSTIIAQGRARGIVVATAMNTKLGEIAEMLRERSAEGNGRSVLFRAWSRFTKNTKSILGLEGTPLQVKLGKFAILLFAFAILLAVIVFSVNKWDVEGEVLIYGICVAVAVIPESLLAVLTITQSIAIKKMSKHGVIVKKVEVLEALGGVTNICSDKTGTLTQGKMIAKEAWIPEMGMLTVHDTREFSNPRSGIVKLGSSKVCADDVNKNASFRAFLDAIALCNLAEVHHEDGDMVRGETSENGQPVSNCGQWKAVGEPTEIALQVLAMRLDSGKPTLVEGGKRQMVSEFAFDSAVKRMTVVYEDTGSGVVEAFIKGATEAVLSILIATEKQKTEINAMAERMASEGLRVLCVARKIVTDGMISPRQAVECNFSFVGLVGLHDPPRPETAHAVSRCQNAGIVVHMLTGDHIRTATAIAAEVGILSARDIQPRSPGSRSPIMPAADFDKLTDGEIDALETLPIVIARCSPATKARMVDAVHRRQAFCVMTGDGVNDSPSLKRADVGIAMGLTGSAVAKDAADMVLSNDDFASIVEAVQEGRRLFDNIQKFLMHLLISNISQVILLLIALAFSDDSGAPVFPLSPLEILWVNLITSSFLAIGLGLEEASSDIMTRPPHDLRVGVFTKELIVDKMVYGACLGLLCLLAFITVIFAPISGSGDGKENLGDDCNEDHNSSCDVVFRARATDYACLTFLLLVTAWEVKHFTRSIFSLNLWTNRVLFFAVIAGIVIVFPVIYVPVVNRDVFRHGPLGWEWGIVAAAVVVYLGLVESWKATKRYFGMGSAKHMKRGIADVEDGVEME